MGRDKTVEQYEARIAELEAQVAAGVSAPASPPAPAIVRADTDMVTQHVPAEQNGIRFRDPFHVNGWDFTPGEVVTAPWGAWKTLEEQMARWNYHERHKHIDRGSTMDLGHV